ncbi:MAG: hypothetical protein QF777_03475 [Acidimicrobiales bacterium]|jgi:hypothetical protein|nr:hypothetical protein [Actinomycetes bacterium]MDP6160281.1 hypothetical protein [Acidimicrobiales bacterium]MDP6286636.1 hypothetical protein [Acidimicrobiales bacterium]MDP6910610.1 hypothetical protein [Acidimicrobiales bacterium]HJP25516.1 hypothetical protein [Acidimicrobiales bacterium]
MGVRWFARIAAAVAVRPVLWGVALRQAHRLADRHWWRRPPFLPVPARAYAAFRTTTQYGDPTAAPSVHDVIVWLQWVRRFPGD